MDLIVFDPDGRDLDVLAGLIRQESRQAVGMNSVGGRHTRRSRIGEDWLGEAVLSRLSHAGLVATRKDTCWATVLPPGAEYAPHNHLGHATVAVWCIAGNGALHLEPDVVVPDRPGQLVAFRAERQHWVPRVDQERITVAANLNWRLR